MGKKKPRTDAGLIVFLDFPHYGRHRYSLIKHSGGNDGKMPFLANSFKRIIFECIEVFYNRIRRHAKIGNQIPANYANQYYMSNQIAA